MPVADGRAEPLLARMTLAQKVHLLHGHVPLVQLGVSKSGDRAEIDRPIVSGFAEYWHYELQTYLRRETLAYSVPPIPEVGIPALKMTDRPAGVNQMREGRSSTRMPMVTVLTQYQGATVHRGLNHLWPAS